MRIIKIGQIEHEVSTFSVPCRKVNLLLPKTSSGQKTTHVFFLPGTLLLLPAGNVGGEINNTSSHFGKSYIAKQYTQVHEVALYMWT